MNLRTLLIYSCLILPVRDLYSMKDTLYLRPGFVIHYNNKQWKGPSSADAGGKLSERFANNHFHYPGFAEAVTFRHRSDDTFVDFRSGYVHEHPVKQEGNQVEYEGKSSVYTPSDRATEGTLISQDIININGFNYSFEFRSAPADSWYGNRLRYFYTAKLDTLMNPAAYVSIYAQSEGRNKKKLIKNLRSLGKIGIITPAALDSIHQARVDATSIVRELNRGYEDWLGNFDLFMEPKLTCTELEMIQDWTMDRMTQDDVFEHLVHFNYTALADSIEYYHRSFIRNSTSEFIDRLSIYKNAAAKESEWYSKITNGTADLGDYLDYMSGAQAYTFLDTLDMLRTLRTINTQRIVRDLETNSWDDFHEELSERFTSNVSDQFAFQVARQFSEFSNTETIHYRKVAHGSGQQIFLFSSDQNFTSSYLGIFIKKEGRWNGALYPIDLPLEKHDGKGFRSFNHMLSVVGDVSTVLIDIRDDNVKLETVAMDTSHFSQFDIIHFIHQNMSESSPDHGFDVVPGFQSHASSEILYHQPFIIADLDRNQTQELVSYSISNGKIVQSAGYTMIDRKLHEIPHAELESLLQRDEQFLNLMIYSQLGTNQ